MRVVASEPQTQQSSAATIGRVAVLNAVLLGSALLFGAVVYSNRIGSFGDAMNMFKADPERYPSALAFIRFWYTVANGRIGGFTTDSMFQRLAAYFPFSPETYPWWLLCSVSLFAALATPVNIAIACERLLGRARLPVVAWVAVAWALWLTHPVLLGTSFLGQAVGEYFVAFYLFSLALVALTVAFDSGSRGWLAATAVIYLYASISYEQVLAGAPVVFSAATIIAARRSGRRETLPLIAWWALTFIAAAVVLLSPGQRLRSATVGAHAIPAAGVVLAWLGEAVSRPYGYLLHWVPRPLLWSVPVHAVLLTAVIVLAARRRGDEWLLAAGFFIASLVSTAHLLLATYAPERAAIFPAVLLLGGFLALSGGTGARWRLPRAGWAAVFVVLLAAAVSNVHASAAELARTVWLSSIRLDAYHRVLSDHRRTGNRNYQLADCPPGLDAPWGIAAYFGWSGAPEVDLQLEGRDAFTRANGNVMSCRVPPLASGSLLPSADPVLARALLSLSSENHGITRYDYWVPASADACDLTVSANPNADGSPLYLDTFRYQLAFTNHWNAAANQMSRALVSREVVSAVGGGTRTSVTLAWNGADVATAPLGSWVPSARSVTSESALVRVVIDHPSPRYLGDYDRLSLTCR